jgi:hypothetical protein
VLDLARWEKALEEGRVVSTAMLQAMRAPARLPGGLEAGYGYGTRLGATGPHRKLGHTGGGQGNKAVVARYPDDDVTVAVLLNTERSNAAVTATDIEDRIERLLFGLAEPSPPRVSVPAPELRRYAGQYLDGSRLVRIGAQDGMLTVRPGLGNRRDSRLVPGAGELFLDSEEPSVELRFHVRDGQAQGYSRYHYGWFVGLGLRSGDRPNRNTGTGEANRSARSFPPRSRRPTSGR